MSIHHSPFSYQLSVHSSYRGCYDGLLSVRCSFDVFSTSASFSGDNFLLTHDSTRGCFHCFPSILFSLSFCSEYLFGIVTVLIFFSSYQCFVMSYDLIHCFGMAQVLMEERWWLVVFQSPALERKLG